MARNGRPRALDDKASARMRELSAAGHGVDAIRDTLEREGLIAAQTSSRTIYRALERDGPKPDKPPPLPPVDPAAIAPGAPGWKKRLKPRAGTVEHLRAWARKVNKAMEVAFDAKALRAFSVLSSQLERMTEAIQRLTPPPPPDPRRDPANIEATEETVRRLTDWAKEP